MAGCWIVPGGGAMIDGSGLAFTPSAPGGATISAGATAVPSWGAPTLVAEFRTTAKPVAAADVGGRFATCAPGFAGAGAVRVVMGEALVGSWLRV